MSIYVISAILATTVLCTTSFFIIRFIHSANKALDNVNKTMEEIRHTAKSLDKTATEAEVTLETINKKLPTIMSDLEQTTTNTKLISENADAQMRKGIDKIENSVVPALTAASNLGNYVLRGYTTWRRLKRGRL
ncbi:MAG: hypothetical protein APF84_19010 [Gracilibacter sp. BRH_c7a]|nr:MAG: hypothetical protein APF84_19010 [Gracilibacter sp. BRH_c7a]